MAHLQRQLMQWRWEALASDEQLPLASAWLPQPHAPAALPVPLHAVPVQQICLLCQQRSCHVMCSMTCAYLQQSEISNCGKVDLCMSTQHQHPRIVCALVSLADAIFLVCWRAASTRSNGQAKSYRSGGFLMDCAKAVCLSHLCSIWLYDCASRKGLSIWGLSYGRTASFCTVCQS